MGRPARDLLSRKDAERELTPAQFDAYVNAPVSAFEREERAALIAWFQRRYPTPAARLAYVRRAYARWKAAQPPSQPPSQ